MLGLRLERVEVDHHEIDGLDAVLRHVGDVLGIGRVGQDSAVDLRVQGDHPVFEDGRQTGQLGDIGDRHTRVGDRSRGTAARHEAPSELVKRSANSTMPDLS